MLNRFSKRFVLMLLVTLMLCANATAARAGVGLGLLIQTDPSAAAFSIAGDLGDTLMLAGAFTPIIGRKNYLYAQLDALIYLGKDFETGGGPIRFYLGAGVRGHLLDYDTIGGRLPVGMKYDIHQTPVQFFVEAAPVFDLIINPDRGEDYQMQLMGAMGIRYVFGSAKQIAAPKP